MSFYVYRYKKNSQESEHVDLHGTLNLDLDQFCKVKVFEKDIFQGSYYCSNSEFV